MVLAVATRKGLFLYDDDFQKCGSAFLGDPVSFVHRDPHTTIMYAALDHGHFGVKLHRSHNNGVDWEPCACPSFPEKPETTDDDDKNPWSLNLIWSMASGHGASAGHLWCGTIPGGLFKSVDNGSSWQLIESLWQMPERKKWFGGGKDQPGIHSICVDPRNDQQLFVGISCGGIWYSADGGETWAPRAQGMRAEYMPPEQAYDVNIQDPHCLVQCRDQPDSLWCQHHNGIFRSDDHGCSWVEIKDVQPSAFGFACAVDPQDAQHAWFVPAIKDEKRYPCDAQLVVTETRDAGQTFLIQNHGLPQGEAYDLVYRHGLAVDAHGQHLAFGSTTGNLWHSDDSGQTWSILAQHLPPIYAVRMC